MNGTGKQPAAVPEEFALAYGGLWEEVGLLAGARAGARESRRDSVEQRAARWRRERCGGSDTLAKSAVLAVRYQIASRGLDPEYAPEADQARLRALSRGLAEIEEALDPQRGADADGLPAPTPAGLPAALRARMPRALGLRLGEVAVLANPEAGGWHLSVSHPRRWPTWAEILGARTAFGRDAPELWARVPPGRGDAGRAAPRTGRPFEIEIFENPGSSGA